MKEQRTAVYKSLFLEGRCQPGVEQNIMLTYLTFEQCGYTANALHRIINEHLEYNYFSMISLKGHYLIQSNVTGLIYDLVSIEGLPLDQTDKLAYFGYLNGLQRGKASKSILISHYALRYFQDSN